MYIIVARALTRLIGLLRRFRDDGIHRRHSGGIHGRVIGRRSVLIAGAVFHRSVFATLLGAFRADVVCRADSERRNASRNECHDLLFSTYLFVCVIIERARLNGEREREREFKTLIAGAREEVFFVFLTSLRFLVTLVCSKRRKKKRSMSS